MAVTTGRRAHPTIDRRAEAVLRAAAVVFLLGFTLHTADHLRRGLDATTSEVLWAGSITGVVTLASIGLTLAGHRRSAEIAYAVGFGMAVGVSLVHLTPHWSALSDSLPYGDVDGWTWAAVLAEVSGAIAFGGAGWYAWRHAARTA